MVINEYSPFFIIAHGAGARHNNTFLKRTFVEENFRQRKHTIIPSLFPTLQEQELFWQKEDHPLSFIL